LLVVQLGFNPAHQEIDVLWGADHNGLLHFDAICPAILKSKRNHTQRLLFLPYWDPADITGQEDLVQNSVMVPYNKLISLKKSTAKALLRQPTAFLHTVHSKPFI